jgi:DNA repair photolyase
MVNNSYITDPFSDKLRIIINKPISHILIDSKKQLHGWWSGKRECTSERLLVNPYNGCSFDCWYCYAKSLWGYFKLYENEKVITVCKDFDKVIAKQLDLLSVASCGYISPVTDPFQPLNKKYRLSEKIIKEFIDRNIPIEFITKGVISDEAISLISNHEHSFGQVTILTPYEKLRKILVPKGANTYNLFENLRRLTKAGNFAVCRIDPIFPYLTDGQRDLEKLVKHAVSYGANHIVASCLDIYLNRKNQVIKKLDGINPHLVTKYQELYTEKIGPSLHANINYRKNLFSKLKDICNGEKVTFALCMEFEKFKRKERNKKLTIDEIYIGLNKEFMTSFNCEGTDIPIYIKKTDGKFHPAPCSNKGNCLSCTDASCGIDELASGADSFNNKGFKLSDYRRWSKIFE